MTPPIVRAESCMDSLRAESKKSSLSNRRHGTTYGASVAAAPTTTTTTSTLTTTATTAVGGDGFGSPTTNARANGVEGTRMSGGVDAGYNNGNSNFVRCRECSSNPLGMCVCPAGGSGGGGGSGSVNYYPTRDYDALGTALAPAPPTPRFSGRGTSLNNTHDGSVHYKNAHRHETSISAAAWLGHTYPPTNSTTTTTTPTPHPTTTTTTNGEDGRRLHHATATATATDSSPQQHFAHYTTTNSGTYEQVPRVSPTLSSLPAPFSHESASVHGVTGSWHPSHPLNDNNNNNNNNNLTTTNNNKSEGVTCDVGADAFPTHTNPSFTYSSSQFASSTELPSPSTLPFYLPWESDMGIWKRFWCEKQANGGPSRFASMVGLDKRSLALFRFALGYVCFWDLWNRWVEIWPYYCDGGVLPRNIVLEYMSGDYQLLPHVVSGTLFYINLVFVFHLAVILCFWFGFYTRTANVLLWWLTNALLERNMMVSHGGDIYMRVMVFWAMFLPCGELYSIDAVIARWRAETNPQVGSVKAVGVDKKAEYHEQQEEVESDSSSCEEEQQEDSSDYDYEYSSAMDSEEEAKRLRGAKYRRRGHSTPSKHTKTPSYLRKRGAKLRYFTGSEPDFLCDLTCFGPKVQLFVLYVSASFHKTAPEWHTDYTALFFALQLDFFRSHVGDLILNGPWFIMKTLTWGTLKVQRLGSLLVLSPILHGPCATIGVFAFFCMHVGMGLCMRLGMFAILGMACVLINLPWDFWNVLLPYLSTPERKRAALYLPNHFRGAWAGRLFAEFCLLPCTSVIPAYKTVAPSDEEVGGGASMRAGMHAGDHRWVVEVNNTRAYGYDAFLAAVELSPFLWVCAPFLRISLVESLLSGFANILIGWSEAPDEPAECVIVHKAVEPAPIVVAFKKAWSRLPGLTVAFLSLFVIGIILQNFSVVALPYEAKAIADSTRLEQAWPMFAPKPPDRKIHHVIESQLVNGSVVDIMANAGLFTWKPSPLSFDFPDTWDHWKDYKNHRWFKIWESMMMGALASDEESPLADSFCRYICREWNARHEDGQRIFAFRIHQMMYQIGLDNSRTYLGAEILADWQCLEDEEDPELRVGGGNQGEVGGVEGESEFQPPKLKGPEAPSLGGSGNEKGVPVVLLPEEESENGGNGAEAANPQVPALLPWEVPLQQRMNVNLNKGASEQQQPQSSAPKKEINPWMGLAQPFQQK